MTSAKRTTLERKKPRYVSVYLERPRRAFTVHLPPDVITKIKIIAAHEGITIRELIVDRLMREPYPQSIKRRIK